MKIFRNPEFKKAFALYSVISVVACVAASVLNLYFGFLMIAVCIAFFVAFMVTSYIRYKKIESMAADIDRILHGKATMPIKQYSEGELAILQSEVYKMTVRLREQQHTLQNDKVYLADSLADISHQIRTPLTSINLLVSFLSEQNISEERRREVTHELYEHLARIDWLITALLKISKFDAGTVQFKKESVALDELIRKSVSPILVPMDLRDQTLQVEAEGEFTGDLSWTCEAITNIVKNCMEHTPDGGTITVTASENALYSEIIIADNGHGISLDDLPHIFERFYKGKNSDDKSFGIGLALARMIISSQNGTIKAENNPTNGARFIIRFYKGTV